MTNQDIVDHLDTVLLGLVIPSIREKILDAMWDILSDNRIEEEESE